MITINLTPVEELENPYWWIPDLIVFSMFFILSVGSMFYYISSIEAEIESKDIEKQRMASETEAVRGEVERFNGLNVKIVQLESKKNSLKRITESKLVRFLPIILLENIQNLKPDGVWLTSLGFVDKKNEVVAIVPPPPQPLANDPNARAAGNANRAASDKMAVDTLVGDHPFIIEILGTAVDNVQIADFMMSLKATQNQIYEKSDLRTQLFFSDVAINFSQISTQKGEASDKGVDFVNFKLQLHSRERISNNAENNGRFSQFIDEFRRNGQAIMN